MDKWVCVKGTEACRFGPGDAHGAGMPCETTEAWRKRLEARDFATEERLAWDSFAAGATVAGAVTGITPGGAATFADQLLEERRKRFGDGK